MKSLMKERRIAELTVLLMLVWRISAWAQGLYAAGEAIPLPVCRMPRISEDTSEKEGMIQMTMEPRSEKVSSIELELTDEGGNVAGIYSEILCYMEMEEIYMTVCLQQSADQRWITVNTKDFSWDKKILQEKDLTMALVSYKVGALEPGQYRLRALYAVYEQEGDGQESRTVTTPAIEIP